MGVLARTEEFEGGKEVEAGEEEGSEVACRAAAFARWNSPSIPENDGARDRARRIRPVGAALEEPLAVLMLNGPSGWASFPWVCGRLKSKLVVRLNLRPGPERPRDFRGSL